jgi:hypothetical protein
MSHSMITANTLSVKSLSAISANIGNVTSGSMSGTTIALAPPGIAAVGAVIPTVDPIRHSSRRAGPATDKQGRCAPST